MFKDLRQDDLENLIQTIVVRPVAPTAARTIATAMLASVWRLSGSQLVAHPGLTCEQKRVITT